MSDSGRSKSKSETFTPMLRVFRPNRAALLRNPDVVDDPGHASVARCAVSARRHVGCRGVNFPPKRDQGRFVPVQVGETAGRVAIRRAAGTHRHGVARLSPGRPARSAVWIPGRWPVGSPRRPSVQPSESAAGSVRQNHRPSAALEQIAACRPGSEGDGPLDSSAATRPRGRIDPRSWATERRGRRGADRHLRAAPERVLHLNQHPAAVARRIIGLASGPALEHLTNLGVTAVEIVPVHYHADEWRSWSQAC